MIRLISFVVLLSVLSALSAVAQEATAVPDFVLAESSPVALYDALLTIPFPDDLLPVGVASLEAFEWRDSNDPDLAGAIGGIIFADGDPFGSPLPTSIAYMVYPDISGPQAPLATAARYGELTELEIDDQAVPAVSVDTGENVALFTAVENVFVYGMVPAAGKDAAEMAEALTQAGVTHLLELAAGNQATPVAAAATPEAGGTRPGEDPLLALAAAPFPATDIPFEVGTLVVLPMTVSADETAGGLVGVLLVRDADRIYPYPLVMYRVYEEESAALDYVSAAVRGAGMSALAELPPEIEIPYPTTMIDQPNDTTTVLVQVGATIVIGNATTGDPETRHATAMTLAQIAVDHLDQVLGAP